METCTKNFECQGQISIELRERIGKKSFQFLSTEYLFKIKTVYSSQTTINEQKIERTLLDIIEI